MVVVFGIAAIVSFGDDNTTLASLKAALTASGNASRKLYKTEEQQESAPRESRRDGRANNPRDGQSRARLQ